jgi:hypothetical protein
MPSIKIRHASLLLASIIGALMIYSGPAFAAGVPIIEGSTSHVGKGANVDEFGGKANPNGAATTVQWEYRKTTAGEFKAESTTPTKSIGSGSSGVAVSALSGGLTANTSYEFRLKATNSFGSTFSTVATFTSPKWEFASGKGPAEYSNSAGGTSTISFTLGGGTAVQIACTGAAGQGTLGTTLGGTDKLEYFGTTCTTTLNGVKSAVCKPKEPLSLRFYNNNKPESGQFQLFFSEECAIGETIVISAPDPFLVSLPLGSLLTTQSVTMTGTGMFSTHPVTFVMPLKWTLTGTHKGEAFGVTGG